MASAAAEMSAVSPLQKLQLLADALAHDFSLSQASPQAAAALCRLLPGLCYLSVGVSNPAQGGMFVSAANCAAGAPCVGGFAGCLARLPPHVPVYPLHDGAATVRRY